MFGFTIYYETTLNALISQEGPYLPFFPKSSNLYF